MCVLPLLNVMLVVLLIIHNTLVLLKTLSLKNDFVICALKY